MTTFAGSVGNKTINSKNWIKNKTKQTKKPKNKRKQKKTIKQKTKTKQNKTRLCLRYVI